MVCAAFFLPFCEYVNLESREKNYLACSVHDFSGELLTFILDRFIDGILDRGIVRIDEAALGELNC